MQLIRIGRDQVLVKDYYCSSDGNYYLKNDLKLWLYINLTDGCPAACPFCVHAAVKNQKTDFSLQQFRSVLKVAAPHISGISLTGGEPMTEKTLIEDLVGLIHDAVDPNISLEIVTNGTDLKSLSDLRCLDSFTSIHISRHAADDEKNRRLMRWPGAPSRDDLRDFFTSLKDRGAGVLNCVLQKNGIKDLDSARDYLEMAAGIGAANVSFIGMFLANEYCRENYISPLSLEFHRDQRFTIWNHFSDHDFCQCSSGDYHAKAGYIRFYYRCPGNSTAPDYCRQFVYGADNVLRSGFGSDAGIIKVL